MQLTKTSVSASLQRRIRKGVAMSCLTQECSAKNAGPVERIAHTTRPFGLAAGNLASLQCASQNAVWNQARLRLIFWQLYKVKR